MNEAPPALAPLYKHTATLQDAITLWGQENQVMATVEELGELLAALNHIRRGRIDRAALASEVADVLIMLGQIERMYQLDLETPLDEKLTRLRARVLPEGWTRAGTEEVTPYGVVIMGRAYAGSEDRLVIPEPSGHFRVFGSTDYTRVRFWRELTAPEHHHLVEGRADAPGKP